MGRHKNMKIKDVSEAPTKAPKAAQASLELGIPATSSKANAKKRPKAEPVVAAHVDGKLFARTWAELADFVGGKFRLSTDKTGHMHIEAVDLAGTTRAHIALKATGTLAPCVVTDYLGMLQAARANVEQTSIQLRGHALMIGAATVATMSEHAEFPAKVLRPGTPVVSVSVASGDLGWALSFAAFASGDGTVQLFGKYLGGWDGQRLHVAELKASTASKDVLPATFAQAAVRLLDTNALELAVRLERVEGKVDFHRAQWVNAERAITLEGDDVGEASEFTKQVPKMGQGGAFFTVTAPPTLFEHLDKAKHEVVLLRVGPSEVTLLDASAKVLKTMAPIDSQLTGVVTVALQRSALLDAIDYPEDMVRLHFAKAKQGTSPVTVTQVGDVVRTAVLSAQTSSFAHDAMAVPKKTAKPELVVNAPSTVTGSLQVAPAARAKRMTGAEVQQRMAALQVEMFALIQAAQAKAKR